MPSSSLQHSSNIALLLLVRILAVLLMLSAVITSYLLLARPYQLTWGASTEEINRPMPGDELDRSPTFFATRAITIEGTPEEIWPWLVQMGYNRGGFYGYDIIENVGSDHGMRSAEQILPEYQQVQVGDELPLSAVASLVFHAVEPNRYLIWSDINQQGSFLWALYPVDEYHTRLVSRIRWSHHWQEPGMLFMDLFTELTDYLAVRKVLIGIKQRVEGDIEPWIVQMLEFGIYVTALLVFLITNVFMLVWPVNGQRWLAGLGAGAAWLITWYSTLPVWFGIFWIAMVFWSWGKVYKS